MDNTKEHMQTAISGESPEIAAGPGPEGHTPELELAVLLETIERAFGYDFREYNRLSLLRRVEEFAAEEGVTSIVDLASAVLRDPALWSRLQDRLTVCVTGFYRNPEFFAAMRRVVIPELQQYEFIRIWHAGCASGEEVYSAAIVLDECGLLGKSRIYATDLNRDVLHRAREGAYALEEIDRAEADYREGGGSLSIRRYGSITGDTFVFDRRLRDRIVFAEHDLVHGGKFNEFDLIVSRNVLVHFSEPLQERVIELYTRSLSQNGILGLGPRETVMTTTLSSAYEPMMPAPEASTGAGTTVPELGFYRRRSAELQQSAAVVPAQLLQP